MSVGDTAPRDANQVPALLGTSNTDGTTVTIYADPVTHRLLVDTSTTGSLGILAVAGTIDDSNLTFTVGSLPTVLIINGGTYKTTGGSITWSYLAGTITLSSAVGTGGSIFGLN